MKNAYLYSILFLLATFVGYGQNENNHWILGTSDVNFSSTTPSVSMVSNSGNYGKASVSDASGNLLFYTDGYKVWNKNHLLMQNGQLFTSNLMANYNIQPVVIVPHPSNNGIYYIFCSEIVYLGTTTITNVVDYHYYIVDFNDSSYPLGKVIVPSDCEFVRGNPGYFAPITCVKNSTNDGYFVVIHSYPSPSSGGSLLSYKITSSGLNTTPVETSLPNDIHYYNQNLEGEFQNSTRGIMKFSPDNLKFGELVLTDFYHQGPNTYSSGSRLFKMDFNNASGTFSNFSVIEDTYSNSGGTNTDFEFSTDSNKAYLVKNSNIYVKDLSNLSLSARKLADFNNSSSYPSATHLQRDKQDNLLISFDGSSFLHKINNQDSYSNSSVNLNFVSLSSTLNFGHTLPQLIPALAASCPTTLAITANVTSGTSNKQASSTLTASNTISSGAVAIYHAGSSVVLTNGFHAASGSRFRGYIEGCSGTFVGRTGENSNSTKDMVIGKDILIYPNPSSDIVTITSVNKIKNISVTSMEGKMVLNQNVDNENEFTVNVNSFQCGIYIMMIEYQDGNTDIERLIKR